MVNYYSSLKSKSEFEDVTKGDIFYLGKRYQLKVVKDVYEHVVLSDNLMQVTIHLKDKRKYRRHLMNWYKQETKKILDEKLPSFANRLSVVYEKVSIRNQKSRWGSCSKKRNLNFNLILSSFPQRIVDYLIIHELSHIVELNHSQKFWKIVYSLDKNYKEHKKWLNTYGSLIKI